MAQVRQLGRNTARKRASPLRFVTAASLFDGHDAAINLVRRLIQSQGAEVIHLGHNRSVDEVASAAIQEDADGVAVSCYQGGHMEYFRYLVDVLEERDAGHIVVFGGGGGTITREEIAELEAHGVERIYHPDDGMRMGLEAMIGDVIARTEARRRPVDVPARAASDDHAAVARMLTALEEGVVEGAALERLRKQWAGRAADAPVVGVTGTGGAGKSSVVDELLGRGLRHWPGKRIAVLAVDPTRRRTGGALLGDRIRMNSLKSGRVYMRSLATRRRHLATSEILGDAILFLRAAGFDLIFVETAGIGQGDSEIVDVADVSLYVMTSDYGAPSQLEKIDMLDYADLIALNKADRAGSEDALRDVRRQWQRNHTVFDIDPERIPVYRTVASHFNDPGVNTLFLALDRTLRERCAERWEGAADADTLPTEGNEQPGLIPASRSRYLAEIAEQGRDINRSIAERARAANLAQHLHAALEALGDAALPAPLEAYAAAALAAEQPNAELRRRYNEALERIGTEGLSALRDWPQRLDSITAPTHTYTVRGRTISGDNYTASLSGNEIPKIAPPRYSSWGDRLAFLLRENLPGHYPYTAGVYPYRRTSEEPVRMFAGEGTPERTNRRFHYLARGHQATRLSTAFDAVTLYGEDPAERPDIYGKVGNSGVSIATLDDMKKLYSGFDLCDPATSVSMTINGPAPAILAFFMNTAIDQQVEKHLRATGGWAATERLIAERRGGGEGPRYAGSLPEGHDGFGLGLLGVSGADVVERETYERIKAETLSTVRGTVQADILKEDQAQNTCIFSTEFGLKLMGDVQEYFVANRVRNYYSVSVSGYHIAEAGANPISQLAFTLANGFTIVEYYLARGLAVDDFAPNLSFFFSNGMDPEYAVIGRVARRIWARALRNRYGASARSQMLKYHIQTSGRSLHAQEIEFNDIRTTLQALYAIFDNCNSLHTNAFDEALTTPTEASVRRAMAIQLIINRELGLSLCQNPWQGSFIVDALTDLVEEAVYTEFERLAERGGVLGAMDSGYQRGRIQEDSLYYERKKHDGSLPLIGVNTFVAEGAHVEPASELMRSTEQEKRQQIGKLAAFHARHSAQCRPALERLQRAAARGENVFAELMETVQYASLGQISGALYRVGGEYRRSL